MAVRLLVFSQALVPEPLQTEVIFECSPNSGEHQILLQLNRSVHQVKI